MVCKECGKEIDEGQELCLMCQMKKEEEEVVTISKADLIIQSGDYQKKFFDYTAYANSLSKDFIKIVAVLASIASYISVFLTWITYESGSNKSKASLFGMASKTGDAGLSETLLYVYAAMILVGSLLMLIFTAKKSIRPLRPRGRFFLAFIPPVITLLGCGLALTNAKYTAALDTNAMTKGIAPNVCIGATVVYLFTLIAELIKRGEE